MGKDSPARAVWTAGLAGAGLRVMRTTARPMIRQPQAARVVAS